MSWFSTPARPLFLSLILIVTQALHATPQTLEAKTTRLLDLLHTISTSYDVPVAEGISLKVHYTAAKAPTRTVVIYLPGRASYFEKNMGLILGLTGYNADGTHGSLPAQPVDFWCIDMRAHGGSGGRLAAGDQRGHIDSFDTYLNDIHTVLTKHIAPFYKDQKVSIILMGNSMGGHLALRYLQDHPQDSALPITKTIVLSPMIDFSTKPWPTAIAKALACSACAVGLDSSYVVGYGPVNLTNPDFKKHKDHHSPEAFAQTTLIMQHTRPSVTGGPTYGWVKAAFESEEQLNTKPLPSGLDIVAFVPEQDTTVSPDMTKGFATRHGIKVIAYPKAAHNLMKEPLAYAPTFWQDLYKNVSTTPGTP